jgi:hypothetical protein
MARGMDTIRSKISAAVFLLHAAFAVIAILALFTDRAAFNSWGSIAELLALVLKSSPRLAGNEKSQNLGAGIKYSDIWEQTLIVRSDAANNLELTFVADADDKGLLGVGIGQKHG